MPVHDWTLVEPGVFHDFHTVWIGVIRTALNSGLLPAGFYAMAEQNFGGPIADVLTLHASPTPTQWPAPPLPEPEGPAVAIAPPKTAVHRSIPPEVTARRRNVAIRHVSGHRLVALIEVVSQRNKDRDESVHTFADKVVEALDAGVHVLVVDLYPPTAHDLGGMHSAILRRLGDETDTTPPADRPLTVSAYTAGPRVDLYAEHIAVGGPIPAMPLFLSRDRSVNVPLEETYVATYRGMSPFWRGVLEGQPYPV